MCAAFPAGTSSDTAVDSLACRVYHATVAANAATTIEVSAHCLHAGATGGSTCGTVCEAYCDVSAELCTGTNSLYASTAACLSACADFDFTGTLGTSFGGTYQCRAYHLAAAASGDDTYKDTHCPHAGASPTGYCFDVDVNSTCALITATCTGTDEQFNSEAECNEQLDAIFDYDAGTADLTSGLNLACRRYHAGVAAQSSALATVHCPHTGMSSAGTCGTNCESFCALHTYVCGTSDTTSGYASFAECVTECAAFTVGTLGATSGDTLACRLYHTGVAAQSASLATTHCPHGIAAPLSQCTDAVAGSASHTGASALVVAALAAAVIAL